MLERILHLFRSRRERELEEALDRAQAINQALSNPDTVRLDYDAEEHKALWEIKADFVPLFIGWMAEWFKEQGGINYVEVQACHPRTGPLLFTMQRQEGKTPHELRCEAETRICALEEVLHDCYMYFQADWRACGEHPCCGAAGYMEEIEGVMEIPEGWNEE